MNSIYKSVGMWVNMHRCKRMYIVVIMLDYILYDGENQR